MPLEIVSREEINATIAALLKRVDAIKTLSAERFPLYRVVDEPWKLSSGGSWMGGFWAGIYWLKAFRTQKATDRDTALRICQQLASKLDNLTLQRSLIFNYGAGLGARLFNDSCAQNLSQLAGQALARSIDNQLGFIPLGHEMGAGERGKKTFSIDPLASTLTLLDKTGHAELAKRQMSVALTACYANHGQWHAEAYYQSGQFSHTHRAGDWARGQAWAMLALVQACHLFGNRYLPIAQQSVDYWVTQYQDKLPANRLSQPDGECDPCANVMSGIAMLGLAPLLTNTEQIKRHALQQLTTVVRSHYLKQGSFVGHCYRTTEKQEQCVESPCGLFFLLAALMIMDEQIDPLWI